MAELDNPDRLAALDATELLDSEPEPDFDRITQLASRLLGTPVGLISLVDHERQFFKSQHGLPAPRQTPLTHSFCQHVVVSERVLAVTDATADPRVRGNLAIRDLNVTAYLGVPLTTPDGQVLGSLCAIESKPRQWSEGDLATLLDLGRLVMNLIALRNEIKRRKEAEKQHELLAAELHHRVKNTLATVQAVIQLSLRSAKDLDGFGASIGRRIASLANTHTLLSGRQWGLVSFKELLVTELAPYDGNRRVVIEGDDFKMASQSAVSLGLVIHELATNASKYGSLSNENGKLSINWTLAATDNNTVIDLNWVESGGPTIAEPGASGFGSMLLKRLLTGQMNGRFDPQFAPEGLRLRAVAEIPVPTPGHF